MLEQLKERAVSRRHEDTGTVAETVILIAGFTIVAILIILWLSTAILNKGADTGRCIENVQSPNYTVTDAGTEGACAAVSHASSKSFTTTDEYKSRYGS